MCHNAVCRQANLNIKKTARTSYTAPSVLPPRTLHFPPSPSEQLTGNRFHKVSQSELCSKKKSPSHFAFLNHLPCFHPHVKELIHYKPHVCNCSGRDHCHEDVFVSETAVGGFVAEQSADTKGDRGRYRHLVSSRHMYGAF